MIQRYDINHDGTLALDATPNGEYCRYADIEPLDRQNRDLSGMINLLACQLAHYKGTTVPHEIEAVNRALHDPDTCGSAECGLCHRFEQEPTP